MLCDPSLFTHGINLTTLGPVASQFQAISNNHMTPCPFYEHSPTNQSEK